MNLIHASIHRPIAVVAAVLMVVLFGYVALQRIPIQMAPDVRQPVIIVKTVWPGAAPAEVEREIINRQGEVLKGLEGVQQIDSRARTGDSQVTLEFSPGVNFDRALLLVANRLDRVNGYPDEASEPTLETSGTEDNAIAWYVLTLAPGNDREMHTYGDFLEDVVQDRLERVDGVAGVNIFGDTEREMRIEIDPAKLARYELTVGEVVSRLRTANASITGGDVSEGKRRYVVRTEGDLTLPQQVESIVLRSESGSQSGRVSRVTVADIATVTLTYKEPGATIRQLGAPAMAFNITREQGANVIGTMAGVQSAVDELAAGPLRQVGLEVAQVYDETDYINSAINLVRQNIIIGGILAAATLMLFLRSWRPTLVVTLSIPVSVIGSFVAMAVLGRSLNVISLAGIAFAVGMVVDAAIVVLENIYRLRQEGHSRVDAAYQGAAQVWGAVLVSALTTVMVFIPILVMELEVGQLFRDIAVAISVSVLLSLVVAVTLIPALAKSLLRGRVADPSKRLHIPVVDDFARAFVAFWQGFAHRVTHSRTTAFGIVGLIMAAAVVFVVAVLPKLDYLPTGNRNFVFGFVQPPAGYNKETVAGIVALVENATRPLWVSETGPEEEPGKPPKIDRFFYAAFDGRAFIGAKSMNDDRAGELIPVLQGPVFSEPGTFAFVFQPSLFGRSVGGGRSIDIDISGPELETLFGVGQQAFFRIVQAMPFSDGHRTRPLPAITMDAPEVRVLPDRVRLADNGLSATDLGQAVDAFNDGLRVAEITVEGRRIDLTLAGPDNDIVATQGIGALPVVTSDGRIVPVDSLADVVVTTGPTEIRRTERQRTVTMRVTPMGAMPLQQAIDIIEEQVVGPLREQGLPPGVSLNLSGTADKLTQTRNEIVLDLLLALIIVYLVMAVLFESFLYPLIIMLSVPVAAACWGWRCSTLTCASRSTC